MNEALPKSILNLVKVFSKLPGVGSKTALRYVLHLIQEGETRMGELARALEEAQQQVELCPDCFGLALRGELCQVCADPGRRRDRVCVVETVGDMLAIETTALFDGTYFVLHRLLSPLRGIGPDELRLDRLSSLLALHEQAELIIATPLTTDGETTATYLRRMFADRPVKVTRLAAGVPVGGTIEYLDRMTLGRALQDRKEM